MQKVILDTNFIVSSLIQKSFPYLILHDLYIDRKIKLCISEDLVKEYQDVLKREKFARFRDFIRTASWY
jgi:putative PIN family toxin of toxin-antitoxin system